MKIHNCEIWPLQRSSWGIADKSYSCCSRISITGISSNLTGMHSPSRVVHRQIMYIELLEALGFFVIKAVPAQEFLMNSFGRQLQSTQKVSLRKMGFSAIDSQSSSNFTSLTTRTASQETGTAIEKSTTSSYQLQSWLRSRGKRLVFQITSYRVGVEGS